jgi:hypothetical protein
MILVEEPFQDPVAEKNLFNLILWSANVAYMLKNDSEIICTYAGLITNPKLSSGANG